MANSIPYLSDEEIAKAATAVRLEYGDDKVLPIDIERIAEFGFGLGIIPLAGLEEKFGIQNYLTADFKKIIIDQLQFDIYPARVKFTLSHEIGHLVLHKNLLIKAGISSVDELLDYHQLFDNDNYSRLEIQANYFASYLLFPDDQLNFDIEMSVTAAGGIDAFNLVHYEDLIKNMMETFGVSRSCAEIKLKRVRPDLVDKATILPVPEEVAEFFQSVYKEEAPF